MEIDYRVINDQLDNCKGCKFKIDNNLRFCSLHKTIIIGCKRWEEDE